VSAGTLDARIVDEIEELHHRVARSRAENRFGFAPFGVAKLVTEAEAAEQGLASPHGPELPAACCESRSTKCTVDLVSRPWSECR
jgi:hypothetical protein